MKNHTADTLKYYLGKDVWVNDYGVGKLSELSIDQPSKGCSIDYIFSRFFAYKDIYPILKTVDDLTEEKSKAYIDQSEDFVFGTDKTAFQVVFEWHTKDDKLEDFYALTFDFGVWLIDNGFGAKKSLSRPTGYVDIFGMPCVTPKQVDEGFQI